MVFPTLTGSGCGSGADASRARFDWELVAGVGGADGDRTHDLVNAMFLVSRLRKDGPGPDPRPASCSRSSVPACPATVSATANRGRSVAVLGVYAVEAASTTLLSLVARPSEGIGRTAPETVYKIGPLGG